MHILKQYLSELFEEDGHYIYHMTRNKKTFGNIRKYGICSPRKLYEIDKEAFMKKSFIIYKARAAIYLKKVSYEVTAEDVLDYLDNSPTRIPWFSSRSIFFSYLPLKNHHPVFIKELKPVIEIKINVNKFDKYKPVVVGPGSPKRFSTWNEILSERFIDIVRKEAGIKPYSGLMFSKVRHLALDCFHIPIRYFKSMELIR